jgi:parallel beta-helix repeat protein
MRISTTSKNNEKENPMKLKLSRFQIGPLSSMLTRIVVILAITLTAGGSAVAATLCVNQGGTGGCFASIQAAVAAASAGDTIRVAQGTYYEDVSVTKQLFLVGADEHNTIIDASGLLNGIAITKTSDVAVSGFTVQNAETAGIWITDSSRVTVSGNIIKDNDKGLVPPTCPPLNGTPFAQGEAFDCGEGVFLSGVDHSIFSSNIVTGNAGGMLITDDTGPTHDNLISDNSVVRNTELDCGITLPSHSGAGVFHNTVSGNNSSHNGGPGVGIFAPGPGSKAYGKLIINNRLRGNGLPGVTMHNHAAPGANGVPAFLPPVVFDDNLILWNDISENSQDFEDAATSGPTGINIFSVAPMTGTIISQNVIHQEALDIVVNIPAVGAIPVVQAHLNNLPGHVGVQNAGAAKVDATENWWGCSGGPLARGCSTVLGGGVVFQPWLLKPFQSQ